MLAHVHVRLAVVTDRAIVRVPLGVVGQDFQLWQHLVARLTGQVFELDVGACHVASQCELYGRLQDERRLWGDIRLYGLLLLRR